MASSGSAKRLGIEADDPQLESRLRNIEVDLAQRTPANNNDQADPNRALENRGSVVQRRHRQPPPQISGLRVENNVIGALSVKWNSSDLSDLRRYEVQVATDPNFRDADTFTVLEPQYIFPDGAADQTYFVRVRQINSRGEASPYSSFLNTTTGQATFLNLASGSASNITTVIQTSGFSPAELDTGGTTIGTYASSRISFPTAAEALIFGAAKVDINLRATHTVFIRLRVDGDPKQTYENRSDSAGSDGRLTVPGLGFPQLIGAGFHTFDFEVELLKPGGGADTTLTPVEFILSIWEQRN